ncbi:hypothetical protein ABH897_005158 [Paenibacillus sp. RC73]|uniref:hypothetical protein n=1 Tax=Paenibacillus sp. RC73 TaxID=3156250 RepID=UPI00383964AC
MNSHFDGNPGNQQRLIDYIKKSYNYDEIFALGRLLGIDKDDYVSRTMNKPQLCEAIVEIISQRSLFDRFFILLQSEKYLRERIWEDFNDIVIKVPVPKQQLEGLTRSLFVNDEKNHGYSDFSEWIKQAKSKMVLVLGKDNTEESWTKLEMFCNYLKDFGYSPILIKGQEEVDILFNEEKMLAYAAIARFILIEKSEPAGQIDEAHICAINRFVTIWMSEEGKGDTWMQADYDFSFSHVSVLQYNNDTIKSTLKEGIEWAEEYLQKKAQYLNQFYPFR